MAKTTLNRATRIERYVNGDESEGLSPRDKTSYLQVAIKYRELSLKTLKMHSQLMTDEIEEADIDSVEIQNDPIMELMREAE